MEAMEVLTAVGVVIINVLGIVGTIAKIQIGNREAIVRLETRIDNLEADLEKLENEKV